MIVDLQQRTPKNYRQGTHRTRTPDETLAANRRFMPRMGITRLANVTGLDRIGLPVCVAIRPNARSLAASQGKGETLASAMVSALMESIELWHAEHLELPVRFASLPELAASGALIDMNQAPVRADARYEPNRPIHWVEGYDLIGNCARWLPLELVSMNLVRQPGHSAVFLESSNGLSSGNHIAEALVHALAEVIERDAMSLWELYSTPLRKTRQVDLSTVDDPALVQIITELHAKGIVVGVWDVTSDVGVPTYSCVILEDPDSSHWRPIPAYFGSGTHLSPVIALSRAIHEAIQSRLTAISGSRDDMFHADFVRAGNREDLARIIEHLQTPAPTLAFRELTLPIGDTIEEDLLTLLGQLQAVGVQSVMAVDLTRADIGIPVVKVVVPELEPYYTVLYQRGERARRLARELAA